jgi:hypothetical protein
VRETYTSTWCAATAASGTAPRHQRRGGGATFDKPVDNIGEKTFGGPAAMRLCGNQHIYDVNIPGCATAGRRVFVGQRKDPFYIAVGKIFDLINLNPLGPETGGNNNDLEGKNVSTIALEVPIACLTAGGGPVIGGWTTASVRQGRLNGNPAKRPRHHASEKRRRLGAGLAPGHAAGQRGGDRPEGQGQVQRSKPKDDGQFADYVTNPTLPALIQTLFPAPRRRPTSRAPTWSRCS